MILGNTFTFTGNLGPGHTVTSLVFEDVHNIEFDFEKQMIDLTLTSAHKHQYLQYSNLATLTWTITAGDTAVVAST